MVLPEPAENPGIWDNHDHPPSPLLPKPALSVNICFHSPHYSCLALRRTTFDFCPAVTWIQVRLNMSSFPGNGFQLWKSCLHTSQWEKNHAHHIKRKTSWPTATSRLMSVERAFHFWPKTEGCTGYNSRLQLSRVQSSNPIHCQCEVKPTKIQLPNLDWSSSRRWLTTLLLHIPVKRLSARPFGSSHSKIICHQ